jgi:hypothetical protein
MVCNALLSSGVGQSKVQTSVAWPSVTLTLDLVPEFFRLESCYYQLEAFFLRPTI